MDNVSYSFKTKIMNLDFPFPHTQTLCKFWPIFKIQKKIFQFDLQTIDFFSLRQTLRTPGEEIAFTERPKIHSHSQIFRYGRSIFCLPHQTKFSYFFDSCLYWVSVVCVGNMTCKKKIDSSIFSKTKVWQNMKHYKSSIIAITISKYLSIRIVLSSLTFFSKLFDVAVGSFNLSNAI